MTRIRCRDYSKLTRNIKRIPTRLRHVCCSDPGGNRQRKQAGVLSGVKQQRAGHRVEPRGAARPCLLRFFGTARKYGESRQRSSGSSFLSLSVFDGMASDQQREIPEC